MSRPRGEGDREPGRRRADDVEDSVQDWRGGSSATARVCLCRNGGSSGGGVRRVARAAIGGQPNGGNNQMVVATSTTTSSTDCARASRGTRSPASPSPLIARRCSATPGIPATVARHGPASRCSTTDPTASRPTRRHVRDHPRGRRHRRLPTEPQAGQTVSIPLEGSVSAVYNSGPRDPIQPQVPISGRTRTNRWSALRGRPIRRPRSGPVSWPSLMWVPSSTT